MAMLSLLCLVGALGVSLAAPVLRIQFSDGQVTTNTDTLVTLGSSVVFTCADNTNANTGSISLVSHVVTELANASVGTWTISSMSVEDQGTYRCEVESVHVDVAVITVPPDNTVQVVSAEGEQPTLSCPLGIVETFSHFYTVDWRVPVDTTVATSGSGAIVPWVRLNSSTLELTVGPLNSTLPRVFECVLLSFRRGLNSLTFSNAPKGTVNIIIPSVQQLRVIVTPTVIASGSGDQFNVSCVVVSGQPLYNAKYQFFHNGISADTPNTSSFTMVRATSTGNITCSATQHTDIGTPIPSEQSPPVLAIILEAPILNRTESASPSTDDCTQLVKGYLSRPQPVMMTLQYFFHTTIAQPPSCTNELFSEPTLYASVPAGQEALNFEVNLADSRFDTRQPVYLTSRFVLDDVAGPCSRPILLRTTGDPCPPPPLNVGLIVGVAVGGLFVVVAAVLVTVAIICGALWIKERQEWSYAVCEGNECVLPGHARRRRDGSLFSLIRTCRKRERLENDTPDDEGLMLVVVGYYPHFPKRYRDDPDSISVSFAEPSFPDALDGGSASEYSLRRLCLIPFHIKQLAISPSGGNFILGCGDAVLIVEADSVAELTDVRYAIILHGPFVHLAGYKPASVVIYLNLEGATLLKPVKLKVRHWCKDTNVESSLRLVRAPHTACELQDRYIFDDVGGISYSSESVFSISEPQCLYCVEMKAESQARYNAAAFRKNLPDTTKFRIQLMCDSLEWNQYLTKTLEEKGWENRSKDDMIASFSFTANQITATPHELSGPGWKAAIHGHQAVREGDFLRIQGKSKDAVDAEVIHGRYPPGIYYQVLFTKVAEQRPEPTFWRAQLLGADVNLFFICNIKQEEAPHDELSVRDVRQNAATAAVIKSPLLSSGLPTNENELQLKYLVKWVVPQVAPKWDEVGLQLNIRQYVLRSVEADGGDVVTRCKNMFAKWLDGQYGTGNLPRTWESVLEAVREAVGSEMCRTIEQSISNEDTDGLGSSDPPAKKAKP